MAFNINNNNNPNGYVNFNYMNLNQAAYNQLRAMMCMNPNFGMQDQMNFNNNLNNFIQMNPNIFNMNNPVQNNMMFFPPMNINNSMNSMSTGVKGGGSLPRPNQQNGRIFQNVDSYPYYKGPRINVIFDISTGLKLNIPAPPTETVNGLLVKFCERAGVSPTLLKKELVCIYNATYINPTRQDSIQSFFKQNLGLNDQARIVIIDAKNIIGA